MPKKPTIKTTLPGPRAKKLIKLDKSYVSPSYTRVYPLVVDQAKGMWVHDVDGNSFLDFTAGIAVNATGHCHPHVVRAIQNQAEKLLHMSGTDFYYTAQIQLAEKMASIAPGKGLMVGVEFVKDRETKKPATQWRPAIIRKAFEKGLLILGCGENSIRFCPALSVTAKEIDLGLTIFEEAVREVTT